MSSGPGQGMYDQLAGGVMANMERDGQPPPPPQQQQQQQTSLADRLRTSLTGGHL